MNVTDVRRLKMLLLWGAVRERVLAKGFTFNMVDTKNLCVWVQKNETAWKSGRGVNSEVRE